MNHPDDLIHSLIYIDMILYTKKWYYTLVL